MHNATSQFCDHSAACSLADDYGSNPLSVTFTSSTVNMEECVATNIMMDTLVEGMETFTISITSAGSPITISDSAAMTTVTIVDRQGE